MDINEMQRMKEDILKEYPRMSSEDSFCFECGPNVPCFNVCCSDVTIALTPYDVLRMKKRLGMSSEELLANYTLVPFDQKSRIPVVILKMKEDEKKTCPFVSPEGCTIYSDRPWACRMYPIGLASPAEESDEEKEFFFLLKEEPCEGHSSKRQWKISDWIKDQGMEEYNRWGELFKEVSLHPRLLAGQNLDPGQMEMYYVACYNLDKFRRFIFESSFLEKFQVEPELLEKIKQDDDELLKFSFQWLRFCLFKEPTFEIDQKIKDFIKQQMEGFSGKKKRSG